MKKQMAKHDMAPNSTSASDEEEEEVEKENEVEQSINGEYDHSNFVEVYQDELPIS